MQEKNAIQIICDTISTNCMHNTSLCIRSKKCSNEEIMCIPFFFLSFNCTTVHMLSHMYVKCICFFRILDTKWKFVYNFSSYFIFLFHFIWIFNVHQMYVYSSFIFHSHESNQWKTDLYTHSYFAYLCVGVYKKYEKYNKIFICIMMFNLYMKNHMFNQTIEKGEHLVIFIVPTYIWSFINKWKIWWQFIVKGQGCSFK